ncbi:hypothetical protein [Cryptosporangium japonicum]|uniref:hypothetical protein n=1 Tax=Cryptosporangium japonicum TaxID=80872 RepID=UPI0031DED5B2
MPRSLIDAARVRQAVGDWRGACAAAGYGVRIDFDSIHRRYGAATAGTIRTDLRHLVPDLLRWHLPRYAHGAGRLRAGAMIPLADYGDGRLTLAALTPQWALDAGERVVLTVLPTVGWDRTGDPLSAGLRLGRVRRQRLVAPRFQWDARVAHELPVPPGADSLVTRLQDLGDAEAAWGAAGIPLALPRLCPERGHRRLASAPVHLAGLASRASHACPGADRVALHLGGGWTIVLSTAPPVSAQLVEAAEAGGIPVLPDAVWSRPIDADLIRLGYLATGDLHPLVADALGCPPAGSATSAEPDRIAVRCGTSVHWLVRSDGRIRPLDHSTAELDRERALALLGGPVCGCLATITRLFSDPDLVSDVDLHLQHGQVALAAAAVARRLGSETRLDAIVLPGNRQAHAVLAQLHEALHRYSRTLVGIPPFDDRCPASPRPSLARRRRHRKGDPARHHQVIR